MRIVIWMAISEKLKSQILTSNPTTNEFFLFQLYRIQVYYTLVTCDLLDTKLDVKTEAMQIWRYGFTVASLWTDFWRSFKDNVVKDISWVGTIQDYGSSKSNSPTHPTPQKIKNKRQIPNLVPVMKRTYCPRAVIS